MPRLLKEVLKKGAILICKCSIVKFDWDTTLSKKGNPVFENVFDINKRIPLSMGNTYEVLENYRTSDGLLFLKDLSSGEEGFNYFNTIMSKLELHTPSPSNEEQIKYNESDFKLNEGEEFVLVSKENPTLMYKTIKDKYYDMYPEFNDKMMYLIEEEPIINVLDLNQKNKNKL